MHIQIVGHFMSRPKCAVVRADKIVKAQPDRREEEQSDHGLLFASFANHVVMVRMD